MLDTCRANPRIGRRSFLQDRFGSTVILFAIVAPVLICVTVGAVELTEANLAKTGLQNVVDSVALSVAGQLALKMSGAVTAQAQSRASGEAKVLNPAWQVTTTVNADAVAGSVTVAQNATRPSLFGSFMPPWAISVRATAKQLSSTPLCVLTTQGTGSNTFELEQASRIEATSCRVQSDADVTVQSGAALIAARVQSVGGASGSISPAPITDAPSIPDPFASLPISVPSSCNDFGIQIGGQVTQTLNPGVHCGGINLASNTTLILNPGEHYFTGSTINLGGTTQIIGSDVVLIFKNNPKISFGGSTTMSLDGRKSGPYAGFVIITDRSQTGTFGISTDSARVLHGTIYLPNATLAVSGSASKVADQSPWTVVVAKQIDLTGSPDLVMNTNYGDSTVPVPRGVGPDGALRLVH